MSDKYIVDPYEAHDPYRWQRAENEAKRISPEEKLDLPDYQQYDIPNYSN